MHKKLKDLVDHFSGDLKEIDFSEYGLELNRRVKKPTAELNKYGTQLVCRRIGVWLEIEDEVFVVYKYLYLRESVPVLEKVLKDSSLKIDFSAKGLIEVYNHTNHEYKLIFSKEID